MAVRAFSLVLVSSLTLFACGSSDDGISRQSPEHDGGASGGSSGSAGTGGMGSPGAGGNGSPGAGGTASSGGSSNAGGSPSATGGSPGSGGMDGAGGGPTAASCFSFLPGGPTQPDYDQFSPRIGMHCNGTNHQEIVGVERLVILGDSISQGTPPTGAADFYRNILAEQVRAKFGDVQVDECAENGARNDDLMTQIGQCFPDGGDERTTLTVFTMGGNDAAAWAGDNLTIEQAIAQADIAVGLLDEAVAWLKDGTRFPNGSHVIFANVYEYTDGTANLSSCPLAGVFGLSGVWAAGIPALVHFEERYMDVAVNRGADMIFLFENFCGHGYERNNPASPCYRGPDQENWFDLTCIHPTPTGHRVIADLFMDVVDE